MSWAGWRGPMRDVIMLLRMAHSLKQMNCLFLEFFVSYFRMEVDPG